MTDTTPNDPDAIRASRDRYKALFDDLVERRRDLVGEIRRLNREVDRLRRHQLPDGGEWDVQYGHDTPLGLLTGGDNPTHQRRVWYGPVQPITETDTP